MFVLLTRINCFLFRILLSCKRCHFSYRIPRPTDLNRPRVYFKSSSSFISHSTLQQNKGTLRLLRKTLEIFSYSLKKKQFNLMSSKLWALKSYQLFVVWLFAYILVTRHSKLRTQGSMPRTQKQKTEAKTKDSPSEDRPSRGQGQECSRPRTQAQVFSIKKGLQENFSGYLQIKKSLQKFFSGDLQKKKKIFARKFVWRSPKEENKTKQVFANFPRCFWRFPTKF